MHRSLCALAAAFLALLACAPAGLPAPAKLPFTPKLLELPNGLKAVVVPTDTPGVMAYFTAVRTGSKFEVEKGRTGYAHFFEHMMFRGSKGYSADARRGILAALGSEDNAWTAQDNTTYTIVTQSEALPRIAPMEADRFINLDYSEADFRTEAGAILGEYNTGASSPELLLEETLLGTAFTVHPYRHTVMGFLDDIKAMPEGYEYSRDFFRRYYTPDNVAIFLVGDVDPEKAFPILEAAYGRWDRKLAPPPIPEEPPQTAERRKDLTWKTPTLPKLWMAYKIPSASREPRRMADLAILAEMAFGPASELRRKLVLDDRIVADLDADFEEPVDPGLFTIKADLYRPEDLGAVEGAVTKVLARLGAEGPDPAEVARVREHVLNRRLLELGEPQGVAYWMSRAYVASGDPLYLEKQLAALSGVTPESVRATAAACLTPARRTVVRLTGPGAEEAATAAPPVVRIPSPSDPSVEVRVVFLAGSTDDPPGKEGLTALTARMVAEGGTARRTYEEVIGALYPTAAEIRVHVDQEMTVFWASAVAESAGGFFPVLREVLLQPGFREEDFVRIRSAMRNRIVTGLRSEDDEDLAKEALSDLVYEGSPGGHRTEGTVQGLDAITLEDVRRHWARTFTRGRVLPGLAGRIDESHARSLEGIVSALPAGEARKAPPAPAGPATTRVLLIEKPVRSTAISIGFPLDITPSDPDYPALWLAASCFGEHRAMHGRLFQRLRAARGLNYGDYAYIAHYVQDRWRRTPIPNIARTHQVFSIWLRPVENENRLFAIRAALHELRKLVEEGLTEEEFAEARDFLIGSTRLREASVMNRLGIALDDVFYGTPSSLETARAAWRTMTVGDVNRAVRKHLRASRLYIVAVTRDAESLRKAILENAPSPIAYAAPRPPSILEEDRAIVALPIGVKPEDIRILPAGDLFER